LKIETTKSVGPEQHRIGLLVGLGYCGGRLLPAYIYLGRLIMTVHAESSNEPISLIAKYSGLRGGVAA